MKLGACVSLDMSPLAFPLDHQIHALPRCHFLDHDAPQERRRCPTLKSMFYAVEELICLSFLCDDKSFKASRLD